MKTYYQKHRKIKAFQFDGSWQQLQKELPSSIFDDYVRNVHYIIDSFESTVSYNNHHTISSMAAFSKGWPIYTPKGENSSTLYARNLNLGDYVTVHYMLEKYKQSHNKFDIHWYDGIYLKFYAAKDFETHWSSHPIKPR